MVRMIEKMQADMKKEKERMAGVMAVALLDDKVAVKLGDFSDTDLRRIMSLLAGHVDECVAVLNAEKAAGYTN